MRTQGKIVPDGTPILPGGYPDFQGGVAPAYYPETSPVPISPAETPYTGDLGGFDSPADKISGNPKSDSTGPKPVSAAEFARMNFKTLGYRGQYSNVIGDPKDNFRMMVYGMPFQGKTSFVLRLCKDLAMLNKGRIAYLSMEEGIGLTMQKKIKEVGLNNVPGVDFFDKMLDDFKQYKFVVIDSVSDQGMKRDTLRKIFESNPDKAFICIFHATKEGDARGGLDFKHDMDIIIRVRERTPIVEKNR